MILPRFVYLQLAEESDEPDTHGGTATTRCQSWSSQQGLIGARRYGGMAACSYSAEITKESAISIQFCRLGQRRRRIVKEEFRPQVHQNAVCDHHDICILHVPSYSSSHPEIYRRHNRGFPANASIYGTNSEGVQINVQQVNRTPVFGRWRRPVLGLKSNGSLCLIQAVGTQFDAMADSTGLSCGSSPTFRSCRDSLVS
ncbi:uncharacterized protein ARMOST_01519 [Armillaria ostoyae]|uniref:Uncharacterized protein n=1 Tax=Armillaria ostoyae TaxID=47428 RepID=A0A284QP84_ARMOS|nr:uncharacterized protein ARMOST_01519 [Armillaria ostoyae]